MSEAAISEGLAWQGRMRMAWTPADPAGGDDAASRGMLDEAALLLAAFNQMESMHDPETGSPENRRLERIEAKLDLALHLLARVLEPAQDSATTRQVRLSPEMLEWQDEQPPVAGTRLILAMQPAEALPLTLRLPALAQAAPAGLGRAGFAGLPEALNDALYQFVFRRHRQAIRARR